MTVQPTIYLHTWNHTLFAPRALPPSDGPLARGELVRLKNGNTQVEVVGSWTTYPHIEQLVGEYKGDAGVREQFTRPYVLVRFFNGRNGPGTEAFTPVSELWVSAPKTIPNRFPGVCAGCAGAVAPRAGTAQKVGASWVVRHTGCQ
jgi:hypothetical protein